MSDKIRIGIIGAGGIVRERHLPGLARIEGVEITAVCNRTPESTRRVADEYGIPLRFPDWNEVIQSPLVDAVLIGTWPYLHMEATLEAFALGKPVFSQARMARNAQEARIMRDAQRKTGLPAMLCPPPHGMKWDRSMRRLLDEGYVGRVATIRIHSLQSRYLDPHAPLAWRQDCHLSGYNVLTLGIYAEVVRRWFGDHASIQATGQILTEERVEPVSGLMERVHIPDAVWVNARMASGAVAQYSLSGIAHAAGGDRIEVYGSEGTLVYDIDNECLLGARLDERTLKELPLSDDESRGWEVELDFIRVVRGEKEPDPSFEDGVAYMDVVEATARSCQSGMRIELPLEDSAHPESFAGD
ncbi:MAG: Gfo/Idh/MocA family oxidoreductase [Candidatus Omnitrophica bacterium]|nr:MAG: 1,5-anhydro-D-fructose reductase [Candidatus Hinthialibacteria bacterium OLB16]MBE7487395.1 Gfo/Idh/MocA family oxidoreductase [bacterium]MBK7494081.1 Gfo/Idh/MocA family oxidoreductase [Candidatus Omnitrophota bacterium]MBV6480697.1 1,5-anhydro-D-fructose reductase [bacterium]MCC6733623.1 Gfo/Idh/MocA family oxidoreductase [Candidatus Omnitrophota bacterium]